MPDAIDVTVTLPSPDGSTEYDEDNTRVYRVHAQSRNRIITPTADNYGFARWVWDNAEHLAVTLGEGVHFGEYWGAGIQRGYWRQSGPYSKNNGRTFSLFNTKRWADTLTVEGDAVGLAVVPVLFSGVLALDTPLKTLAWLQGRGSVAAPRYPNPEGIIVYHSGANSTFKMYVESDVKV